VYISQVGHTCMFFKLCTCFLANLVEFHSRNKEVLETQQYKLKLKILILHDEAFIETIKRDIWNT
jgi:hypothetical protein